MRTLTAILTLAAVAAAPAAAQETAPECASPPAAVTEPGAAPVYQLGEVDRGPRVANAGRFQSALAHGLRRFLLIGPSDWLANVCFVVEADGRPSNISIARSANPRLEQAALDAVSVMRFRPATVDGQPVRVWVEQRLRWPAARRVREAPGARRFARFEDESRPRVGMTEREKGDSPAEVRASFSEPAPCSDPTRAC
jgi:TonB family protein